MNIRSALACLLALCACRSHLALPEGSEVVCEDNSQCPKGYACSPVALRCVPTRSSDQVPPGLTGDPEWLNAVAGLGGELAVRFTVNEPLLSTPQVRLGNDAQAPRLLMDNTSSQPAQQQYTFRRVLDGREPAGEVAVKIDLIDLSGNVAQVPAGTVVIDLEPPHVLGLTWLAPPDKSAVTWGDSIAYSARVDEPVSSAEVSLVTVDGRSLLAGAPPLIEQQSTGPTLTGTLMLPTDATGGLDLASFEYVAVQVVVRDAAGNASEAALSRTAPIAVDVDPPRDASIAIRGKPLVHSAQVLVDLGVQGADFVLLGGQILDAPVWRPLDLSAPVTVNLTPGTETKTVTARFRDAAWNTTQEISDSVDFDGTVDASGPRLLAAVALDPTSVLLTFDEALQTSSVELDATYLITDDLSQTLAVQSAQLDGDRRVLLATESQTAGAIYTVTVSGVTDVSPLANLIDPAYDTASFSAFGADDPTPPLLLAPAPDSAVITADATVHLAWSARFGASSYTVEVFSDAGATVPVGPASTAPTASIDLSLAPGHTYYWRVRADITTPGQYSVLESFALLASTLRVSCPSDPCPGTGLGTREQPFDRITAALAMAAVHPEVGWTVEVARRAADAPYAETLLVPAGVALEGGWDTAFTTRDLSQPTGLASAELAAVSIEGAQSGAAVRLDGWSIVNTTTRYGYAVYVVDSDQGLVIADSDITGPAGTETSIAMFFGNCGTTLDDGPRLERVRIKGGDATTVRSYGLVTHGSHVTVVDSFVSGGANGGDCIGISSLDGDVNISGSTIVGSPTYVNALSILGQRFGARLRSSVLNGPMRTTWTDMDDVLVDSESSGANPGVTYAVLLSADGYSSPPQSSIVSSTIISGPASLAPWEVGGVRLWGTAAQMTNTLVAVRAAVGKGRCLQLGTYGGAGAFTSLQNNVLTGCNEALVAVETPSTGDCPNDSNNTCLLDPAVLNDEATVTAGGVAGTADANVGPDVVADAAAVAFSDPNVDFHLSGSTPTPVSQGGKDVTSSTCGPDLASPCGGSSIDLDGAARPGTDGAFAIGAYEP